MQIQTLPSADPAVTAETDEIIFASYFIQTPSNVSRVNLNTGEVTVVDINPPIGNAGGATSYFGQVFVHGFLAFKASMCMPVMTAFALWSMSEACMLSWAHELMVCTGCFWIGGQSL